MRHVGWTCLHDTIHKKLKKINSSLSNTMDMRQKLLLDGMTKVMETMIQNNVSESDQLRISPLVNQIKDMTLDMIKNRSVDDAAKNGDLPRVKKLLQYSYPRPNITVKAIDSAAENGHYEIVQFLLQMHQPCTHHAIDNAAANGHYEIVKLLLMYEKPYTCHAILRSFFNSHYKIAHFLGMINWTNNIQDLSNSLNGKTCRNTYRFQNENETI